MYSNRYLGRRRPEPRDASYDDSRVLWSEASPLRTTVKTVYRWSEAGPVIGAAEHLIVLCLMNCYKAPRVASIKCW